MNDPNEELSPGNTIKILLGLAVVSIIYWMFFTGDPKPKESSSENFTDAPAVNTRVYTALDAYTASQHFVEDKLLAPSTAEFPDAYSQVTKPLNDSTWNIDSHVDSQNAFGAMIRNKYSCTIEYHPSTDSIICKGLSLRANL